MEITIAVLISIISLGMTVLNLFFNRKDKSNSDVAKDSFKMGVLEEKIDNLSKQVEKILAKLDSYDHEIDVRIDKSIKNHIAIFHNKGE